MAPLGTIIASAGAASLAARGFSYQDNAVKFTGIGIDSGNYTVRGLSISSGQDPEGKNQVGDVHPIVGVKTRYDDGLGRPVYYYYPGFSFTMGRHKTDPIGAWWNAEIPPSYNTFGHTADALNFALIGDMVLKISNGPTATFHSIGLAQGSDSHGNNWWFGGQNCQNIGSDRVKCLGTDQDGLALYAIFNRGDGTNDVDEIAFKSWGRQ